MRPLTPGGERGQVVVFVAVSLVAVLGIGALSIDAAYMYDKRNKLYAAADAAAKSAAFAYGKNTASDPYLWDFGRHELELLGLTPVTACGSTSGYALCVHRPPSQGPYASVSNPGQYVEAIVTAPSTATFFGRVLGWMSGNPGARAVAGANAVNPAECIIIKEDLNFGRYTFNLNGCGLSVGGDLTCTNPTATVAGSPTPPVSVTGDSTDCSLGYIPGLTDNTGIAPVDPLANKLTAPDPPANPSVDCRQGLLETIGPGCYSNISAAVRNLLPGDYYITGTVNIDNLSGDDVFLYLTVNATIGPPGGNFYVTGNNKRLHLTAHSATGAFPNSPYKGIAIWQDVNDTNQFDAKNQFTLDVTGVIYMPGVDQDFKNTLDITSTECSLFIAKSLTIKNGNGSFNNSNCGALYGGAGFLSTAIVE